MSDDRYQRGLDRVTDLDGKDGAEWADELAKVHPDFARFVVEYPYGDLWTRKGLKDRDRSIAVIASLTTLGGAPAELTSHITMARKIGLSREEIFETIVLMSAYAGFPRAINALEVAKAVFDGEDDSPKS